MHAVALLRTLDQLLVSMSRSLHAPSFPGALRLFLVCPAQARIQYYPTVPAAPRQNSGARDESPVRAIFDRRCAVAREKNFNPSPREFGVERRERCWSDRAGRIKVHARPRRPAQPDAQPAQFLGWGSDRARETAKRRRRCILFFAQIQDYQPIGRVTCLGSTSAPAIVRIRSASAAPPCASAVSSAAAAAPVRCAAGPARGARPRPARCRQQNWRRTPRQGRLIQAQPAPRLP